MGRKKHIFVQVSDRILKSDAWPAFLQTAGQDPDVVVTRVGSPKAATARVEEALADVRHGSFCVYLQWHLYQGDVDFGIVISLGNCRGSRDLARFVYSGLQHMNLGSAVKQKIHADYNELEIERRAGMKDLAELHRVSRGKCVPVVFRPMGERNRKAGESFKDSGRMRVMGTVLAQQCVRFIERYA